MYGVISLADYTVLDARQEYSFQAPLAVVNAAVFHAVTVAMGKAALPHVREDTHGASRYYLGLTNAGDIVALFVLSRGDQLTTIALHPFVRREGSQEWSAALIPRIADLMSVICFEVIHAMRFTDPDFTCHPTERTPPMPTLSGRQTSIEQWRAIFHWQAIYASSWSYKELAAQLGVTHGAVRNARWAMDHPDHTPHGEKEKRKKDDSG